MFVPFFEDATNANSSASVEFGLVVASGFPLERSRSQLRKTTIEVFLTPVHIDRGGCGHDWFRDFVRGLLLTSNDLPEPVRGRAPAGSRHSAATTGATTVMLVTVKISGREPVSSRVKGIEAFVPQGVD